MQQWEYFITWIDIKAYSSLDVTIEPPTDRLNSLGQDGWELAGIVQDESGRFAKFILKRPKE